MTEGHEQLRRAESPIRLSNVSLREFEEIPDEVVIADKICVFKALDHDITWISNVELANIGMLNLYDLCAEQT